MKPCIAKPLFLNASSGGLTIGSAHIDIVSLSEKVCFQNARHERACHSSARMQQ